MSIAAAGLDRIREYLREFLDSGGVEALCAWPEEARRRVEGPVVAVSVRSCEGGPSGFRDYLGERYDPDTGQWQELYGRRLKVTFGLDIYAGRESGAAGCQETFDRLSDVFSGGAPQGLRLCTLSRGEAAFEQDTGLFRCTAEAVCEAYLYAVADEGGAFLDFVVKGERKWI